jgi:ankyrin repeat protein
MRNAFKRMLQLVLSIGVSFANAGAYEDFFKAIEMDDGRTISGLIRRGFDANSPSVSGQTPLFLALRSGSHQAVAALFTASDLKVDEANEANETALMMAALRGQLEWCKRLVERGAALNREGWTPLHYAATGPNTELLAMLLDSGADINALAPNRNTPLMMAARYGPEENVKLLVQRGADKKLINERNLSAADMARAGERAWLVPLLQ